MGAGLGDVVSVPVGLGVTVSVSVSVAVTVSVSVAAGPGVVAAAGREREGAGRDEASGVRRIGCTVGSGDGDVVATMVGAPTGRAPPAPHPRSWGRSGATRPGPPCVCRAGEPRGGQLGVAATSLQRPQHQGGTEHQQRRVGRAAAGGRQRGAGRGRRRVDVVMPVTGRAVDRGGAGRVRRRGGLHGPVVGLDPDRGAVLTEHDVHGDGLAVLALHAVGVDGAVTVDRLADGGEEALDVAADQRVQVLRLEGRLVLRRSRWRRTRPAPTSAGSSRHP